MIWQRNDIGAAALARFAGQPGVALRLPGGDSAWVALQGAQVLSWACGGQEQLYLSPTALADGHSPIRGGIPLCFPQFNQRGPLPKHGLVRQMAWALAQGPTVEGDVVSVVLALRADQLAATAWGQACAMHLQVQLSPGRLCTTLHLHNTGHQAWSFTGALHTYLAVQDATQAELTGLAGQPEWDAVLDVHGRAAPSQRFGAEFDRVYTAPAQALTLQEGARRLAITQSASWPQQVVWNPGPAKCATLTDMPPEGWRQMLCVEAACVDTPVVVPAGAQWSGWQALQQAG